MQYCMGCMSNLQAGDVCPVCGYRHDSQQIEAYHLPPQTILQGRYIVGKVLGFGGFGVTYIGFDAQTERVVAIKEFLPTVFATRIPGDTALTIYQGDATAQFGSGLHRFIEEARTLAQFNGIPGIVDIYDTFPGNNTAYIIMQFLKGQDFKHYLSKNGVLDYETARNVIVKVCETLEPVHAKNIIHRDISPDNIYLTESGEIKLLDFGAARYESAVNSKSLSVILKSGYAPEEQYRSKGEQGSWTDVYSLSATFYKLLTGKTPPDSMERAINDELEEPGKHVDGIPPSAQNAILNALNVKKSDRTKTVTQFKNELLSDGVARVKVKQKSVSTKMPIAAKVIIACSVVAILGLGIFTVSGGFDNLSQETTYGDDERFIMPSLVNLSVRDAQAAMSDIDISVDITTAYIAEQTSNYVITQSLLPDKEYYYSSSAEIQIVVGTIDEALAPGGYLDIVGMEAEEALALLDIIVFDDVYDAYENSYVDFTAVESSPEQKGKVLSCEYKLVENRNYYDEIELFPTIELQIGIGPKQNETFTSLVLTDKFGYYFLHDSGKFMSLPRYFTAELSFDGGVSWTEPIDHLFDERTWHPNEAYDTIVQNVSERGYTYVEIGSLLDAVSVQNHTEGLTGVVPFMLRLDAVLKDADGNTFDERLIIDDLSINIESGEFFKGDSPLLLGYSLIAPKGEPLDINTVYQRD